MHIESFSHKEIRKSLSLCGGIFLHGIGVYVYVYYFLMATVARICI